MNLKVAELFHGVVQECSFIDRPYDLKIHVEYREGKTEALLGTAEDLFLW